MTSVDDRAATKQRSSARTRTVFRTCPLCEAGCGLELTVEADQVTHIRGDRADVFSRGFICPKGSTLRQLHTDPDRLRRPLVRRDGVHVEVEWDEAWEVVAAGLHGVRQRHGGQGFAVYIGNPSVHSLGVLTFLRPLIRALRTHNVFSASTVDQMPKQVASGYLYGSSATVAVPDLDRTDFLLMLGANPYVSNGSLCTAPDFPGRLEALRARGGKLVVVDPRRTRTAESADEWVPVRPGTDALLLAAIARTLIEEGLDDPGARIGAHLSGRAEVSAALAPFSADRVAAACGVDAATIRRLARELAAAPTAAVYGRIGTCTTEFGTTASWLVDVVNVLTGNLDRAGGAMFPRPAAGSANTAGRPGRGHGFRTGRGTTRVRGLPEACGEYPVAALAEEITTPGDGRIRALVTIAGNPVLSTPNPAGVLDEALADLEFMVAVDIYLNETTRHADVILPPPSPLERSHYDLALLQFAIRDVAHYSPAVLERDQDHPDEWELLAKLALLAEGRSPETDVAELDDRLAAEAAAGAVADPSSPVHGASAEELLGAVSAGGRCGPERLLDLRLRSGPYRLTLDALLESPHGVDLGPLVERIPEVLRTTSGTIELAAEPLIADLERLAATIDTAPAPDELLLIGRRDLRSNNSWMHNLAVLQRGKPRCTLLIHPDDAAARGVAEGGEVEVTSPSGGSVTVAAELTGSLRRGVVSLPHGWGHDAAGARLSVAGVSPGVNSNLLADLGLLDPLSGTSALTALPVRVTAKR